MSPTNLRGASNQRGREQKDRVRVFTAEDLLRKVEAHKPDIAVVAAYVEEAYALDLLSESSHSTAYLLKDRIADISTFTDAVRRTANGGAALDPTGDVRTPPKETP